MGPVAQADQSEREQQTGADRGRSLLWIVGGLALGGALVGVLSSSLGGAAPEPCPDARVKGALVLCGEPGSAVEGEPAGARVWLLGGKLDLNEASARDLARIPGVGRGLARAIVAERERRGGFRSVAEVDAVRGVGPAKVRLLERYVEVRSATETPPAAPGP